MRARPYDERDYVVRAEVRVSEAQAARATFEVDTAILPVTMACSAPHQQVKATTMPASVLVIAVTMLGKMSWRFSHAVHCWSNMGGLPLGIRDGAPATVDTSILRRLDT